MSVTMKHVYLDSNCEIIITNIYCNITYNVKVATCFSSVAFASIIVSVHSHFSTLHYQACLYYIIPF